MPDLEKLIRDKQDQLRGRPEDRIDRFMEWVRMMQHRDLLGDLLGLLFLAIIFVTLWKIFTLWP